MILSTIYQLYCRGSLIGREKQEDQGSRLTSHKSTTPRHGRKIKTTTLVVINTYCTGRFEVWYYILYLMM